ncbi:MAG: dihydroorotase [Termitinemataceae bacterium]|nr:MAG: dihydroorotase [Termitinemataceae bacterium]
MKYIFNNFYIADAVHDFFGNVIVEDGIITDVEIMHKGGSLPPPRSRPTVLHFPPLLGAAPPNPQIFDGGNCYTLSAGFIDMHSHFRDPGFTNKETLQTACAAAAKGGYTTVVCMANTNPVTDTLELAQSIKSRADLLGLIDLYPAVSLTKKMQGAELSEILTQPMQQNTKQTVRLLSEDGKDVANEKLFKDAFTHAAKLDLPVSCHCDLNGEDAATERAIETANGTGCHLHIAHVSTAIALNYIAKSQKKNSSITCEATPHHIALTIEDAKKLGSATFGKVAPPLQSESDRLAIIEGLKNGTINVLACDHAPHTSQDKLNGAPGFSGIETSFSVCYTVLVKENNFSLQKLFSLLSASPAHLLGFSDRGLIQKGMRADITIIDTNTESTLTASDVQNFYSLGVNSPYIGKTLCAKVLLTLCAGQITYVM